MIDKPSGFSSSKEKFIARVGVATIVLVIILVGLLFFIAMQNRSQRSDALATPTTLDSGTRIDPSILSAENGGLTNLVAPVAGLSGSSILPDTNHLSN